MGDTEEDNEEEREQEEEEDNDNDDDIRSITAEEEFAAKHAQYGYLEVAKTTASTDSEGHDHDDDSKEEPNETKVGPEKHQMMNTATFSFLEKERSSSAASSKQQSRSLPTWEWAKNERLNVVDREAHYQTLVEL